MESSISVKYNFALSRSMCLSTIFLHSLTRTNLTVALDMILLLNAKHHHQPLVIIYVCIFVLLKR